MARANLSEDKHWYVVRTAVKSEAKAARNLHLAGYEVYLPTKRVEQKHRRTNIILEREQPLMLRYLFVAQPRTGADWFTLRKCEGVESVLGTDTGWPVPVPFQAVQRIFLAERDMQFDDTRAARIYRKEEAKTRKATLEMKFKPGLDVRVTDGPFATFGAQVEEVTKAGKIKALVELFGALVPVEFEAAQLSPAAE